MLTNQRLKCRIALHSTLNKYKNYLCVQILKPREEDWEKSAYPVKFFLNRNRLQITGRRLTDEEERISGMRVPRIRYFNEAAIREGSVRPRGEIDSKMDSDARRFRHAWREYGVSGIEVGMYVHVYLHLYTRDAYGQPASDIRVEVFTERHLATTCLNALAHTRSIKLPHNRTLPSSRAHPLSYDACTCEEYRRCVCIMTVWLIRHDGVWACAYTPTVIEWSRSSRTRRSENWKYRFTRYNENVFLFHANDASEIKYSSVSV